MADLSFLVDAYKNITPAQWEILATGAASVLTVVPGTQIMKWVLNDLLHLNDDSEKAKRQREKLGLSLALFGSFVVAFLGYLKGTPHFAPTFVAVQTFINLGMSTSAFTYFFKPLFNKLAAWARERVMRTMVKDEAKAATVPETGLPIGGAQFDDFSR